MKAGDLETIMHIEEDSFASPWNIQSFESELKKPYSLSFVGEIQGDVVGYIIAWLVTDEIHIANLAVDSVQRRKGIARALVDRVLSDQEECHWVGLEVRRSNSIAQSLYRKLGFIEAGIRENYYEKEHEDAILMVKLLSNVE